VNKTESFTEYVRDQLQELRNVEFRRMFGGHGLYCGPKFFGILFKGRLYFKTDATNRTAYIEHGMQAFQPNARQVLKNYFEVPAEVLEDAEVLVEWARRAVGIPGENAGVRRSRGRK